MFFTPRYVKEARQYCEAVRRVLRYRIDLLTREEYEAVEREIDALERAARERNRDAVKGRIEELEKVIGRVAPPGPLAAVRENCEVILVAIILAAGFRAYIVEPFKIPTGSMQPTLNGVIAQATDTPPPNPLVRAVDFVLFGRTFIDKAGTSDDVVVNLRERSYLNYFIFTEVTCRNSHYTLFAPLNVVRDQMHIIPGIPIRKGETIFRGWVDNGDFVLVNKLAYNFFPPQRGDVFVFLTTGIKAIENRPDFPKNMGSQHYIKRLAGVPGDVLRIDPPNLYVNGRLAEKNVFRRVMTDTKDGYRGYSNTVGDRLDSPNATVRVPRRCFFALGDNSYYSFDSRGWGFVPEKNVTGKAFAVFWPFTKRWGFIE